jgi:hypothetical protein
MPPIHRSTHQPYNVLMCRRSLHPSSSRTPPPRPGSTPTQQRATSAIGMRATARSSRRSSPPPCRSSRRRHHHTPPQQPGSLPRNVRAGTPQTVEAALGETHPSALFLPPLMNFISSLFRPITCWTGVVKIQGVRQHWSNSCRRLPEGDCSRAASIRQRPYTLCISHLRQFLEISKFPESGPMSQYLSRGGMPAGAHCSMCRQQLGPSAGGVLRQGDEG